MPTTLTPEFENWVALDSTPHDSACLCNCHHPLSCDCDDCFGFSRLERQLSAQDCDC